LELSGTQALLSYISVGTRAETDGTFYYADYPKHNLSGYSMDSDIIIRHRSIIFLPMNVFLHNTNRRSIQMMIASVVMTIWQL